LLARLTTVTIRRVATCDTADRAAREVSRRYGGIAMGKGDRRHSQKSLQRKGQRKKKERERKRIAEARAARAAAGKAPEKKGTRRRTTTAGGGATTPAT
jgi:hypothetical protein